MKSELAEKLMSICDPNAPLENNHSLDNTFGIDNLTENQCLKIEKELIKHFDFKSFRLVNLHVVNYIYNFFSLFQQSFRSF
jgi:hypothetical protein